MRLIDRLSAETGEYHAQADEDVFLLLGPVTPADYRRFLARMYGFVVAVERSISAVRGLDRVIDTRRFRKADMLRIDLLALRVTEHAVNALPQCMLPVFDRVEEALGWAYPIERSTLGYTNLYRHLAAKIPGDVAFASSYLKCYFGMIGESWKRFEGAVESMADSEAKARGVIECARSAFRTWRSWREAQDEQLANSDGGLREQELG